ncbi:extracellular solute-binding protein [Alicyclobacillus curvatus]|nr:extracellular solute-binding protein [Alicyclobacillus curvatus]
MKRAVKVTAIGFSVLMMTGMLSGCGGSSNASGSSGKTVTITYWQYTYPSKVTEMKKLIQQFQKQNPNIKVVEQDFPYDQYNQKVAAAMHANQGPDILNLYYGWIPQYVQQGYLQPIPSTFMSTSQINNYYIPMVKDSMYNGKYYALPIAVRSLAIFYNKDMFQKAGISGPPQTWNELISDAQKMTVYQNGKLVQEGFGPDVSGQGYHLFQEILLRQWGGKPFSADNKKVTWDTPAGLQAFQYWMDMFKKDKIGDMNFDQGAATAFQAGKAGMIVDGSFAIGTMKKSASFNWGVAPIPTKTPGGKQENFGSYWVNGIAKGVSGAQLQASEKFIQFLDSTATEKDWLNTVGELPAAASLASDQSILNDPIYGPFEQGLKYAHATFFVNETTERQAFIDETNKIFLQNAPVSQVFNELTQKEQAIRDKYYSSQSN